MFKHSCLVLLCTLAAAGAAHAQREYELVPFPSLKVAGDCPGLLTMRVENATPEGQVGLIYGFREGNFIIPHGQPCAGSDLGIRNPVLARTATADRTGAAVFRAEVSAQACGRVYVEAIDLSTCQDTEVVLVNYGRQLDPLRCEYLITCRLAADAGGCPAGVRALVGALPPAARTVFLDPCVIRANCAAGPLIRTIRVQYRLPGGAPQACLMDVQLDLVGCNPPAARPFQSAGGFGTPPGCGLW